ncbi:phosphopantothenate--cysteine ligase [Lactococcus sp. bn62]|uniref:phosphopantothenate--cysteine ligase n=1 Tax=Lactococcus sp. bn62 TaxID=3037457 RepID=UPI0024C4D6C1|nr:phosphopantothenate--cysteine ligase [Lactococcus sp. bn62]WKY23858.1 phosphopantothenate--cysteine ligase [Lactococcus sp. bn62]
MKILITAGGTTESIDTVRGITNFATGSLGKLTAEEFLTHGHQVILLAGRFAQLPSKQENLTVIPIGDTQDLLNNVERFLPAVDVVVHSMAVSDYRPVYMTGVDDLPQPLTKEQLIHFRPEVQKKISSNSDYQMMLLEKTPKVISFIKKWKPEVLLFGFKLLSGVSEEHLLEVAQSKLKETSADFIIANDLANIQGENHLAFLVSGSADITQLQTKPQIAQVIVKKAEEAYHG